ncbi:MAG: 30S ribosomal protein S8 [Alphaproteobacteria bacterium]|nr:30S ribosomal protein S8 [Alphaproteobacteria bacterium]
MSFTHPIGDMLTRIRNGQNAGKESVRVPASRLKEAVLAVLKEEGYIKDFRREEISKGRGELIVELKYVGGDGAIQEISVISKPGRRMYSGVEKMPRVMNGLGISVVSTPLGVMTDHKARIQNVGGEVLCRVV